MTKRVERTLFTFKEPFEVPERKSYDLSNMNDQEFIQFNNKNYQIAKQDQTKLYYEDEDSYGYFIISCEWMNKWR
jgi:hypothetical protein